MVADRQFESTHVYFCVLLLSFSSTITLDPKEDLFAIERGTHTIDCRFY